jgi:hypothetical protein
VHWFVFSYGKRGKYREEIPPLRLGEIIHSWLPKSSIFLLKIMHTIKNNNAATIAAASLF